MLPAQFSVDFNGVTYPCFFIQDKQTAEALLAKLSAKEGIIAADTETAALPKYKDLLDPAFSPHTANIRLLQVFTGTGAAVIDLHATGPIDLKTVFEKRPSVFHNMTFDYKFLRKHYDVVDPDMHCTCIMARCVFHAIYPDSKSASLRDVAITLFGEEISKKAGASDWSIPELTFEQVKYAALDAVVQMAIYNKLNEYIDNLGLRKVYDIYRRAQLAICEMELNGLSIDSKQHMENVVRWRHEQLDALESVLELTGLTALTDAKLGKWLEDKLDENTLAVWPRTETGKLQTDANTFVDFSHLPIVKPFSRYQKLKKLTTAFGTKMLSMINPATGKLHPTYRVAGAKTGRLSCTEPNIQACPRGDEMRSVFIPSPGYEMVVADYSQVEVRCIAELSNDPIMLKAYAEGHDIYKYTASLLNSKQLDDVTKDERQAAKACFSGDTEVLTPEGWVALSEWSGQQVMQYVLPAGVRYNYDTESRTCRFGFGANRIKFDGTSGQLEFAQPTGYIEKPGVIHRFSDRRNSLALTEDHNVIYVNTYGAVIKTPWKDRKYVRSFINAGWYNRQPIVPNTIVRFIAALTADGSFTSASRYRFGFTKERKARRLTDKILRPLLDAGLLTYTHTCVKGLHTFTVTANSELTACVNKYVNKHKVLSWAALHDFNPDIYLEEAQYWDGHVCKKVKAIMFSTVVKQTVEVMQAMAHTSGRLFNFKERLRPDPNHSNLFEAIYSIHFHQPLSRPNLKTGKVTEETVYCLEVPSGALLIRHNNKISVQGNCVLGLNYGLGAKKFAHYAKKGYGVQISSDESTDLVSKYRELYSSLREWQLAQVDICPTRKYTAYSLSGKSRKMTDEDYYGACMNHPVQGSCAEIMLIALTKVRYALRGTSGRLLATVHDEIVLECLPKDTEKVKTLVEKAMVDAYLEILPSGRTVKNLVEPSSGPNWAKAKQ